VQIETIPFIDLEYIFQKTNIEFREEKYYIDSVNYRLSGGVKIRDFV